MLYCKFKTLFRNMSFKTYFKCNLSSNKIITNMMKNNDFDKFAQLPEEIQQVAVLYIHWPYCRKRCTYCNFNKYISDSVDHKRMQKCLVTELETKLQQTKIKRIKTIFFGGGTPSLAEPQTISNVIEAVSKTVHLEGDAEISLEANPSSFENNKMNDFKVAGINRLSLGIQALNETDLKVFGRDHTTNDAIQGLKLAKKLFSGKTSIDLIFGRPNQSLLDWKNELNKVLSICDDHISLYQLTLETGTKLFKQVASGELIVPEPDMMSDLYQMAFETLSSAGFRRYEVSNFAATKAAESKHNKAYWSGDQYIGIGPGAHGRYVSGNHFRLATIQTLEPNPWMSEVEKYGHGTRKITNQTQLEVLEEVLMDGLRTADGLSDTHWCKFSNSLSLSQIFGSSDEIAAMISCNLLYFDGSVLKTTDHGLAVLDSLLPPLINELQLNYTQNNINLGWH